MESAWPIFSLPKYGAGPGPQRCLALCREALNSLEHHKTPIIKVTGSNGKGSTVAYIEHAARAFGLKTGVLTSPHMFSPAERIRINGHLVSEPHFEIEQAMEAVLERVTAYQTDWPDDTICQSDALLALALDLFVKHACDVICLEAGLGGRLDPIRWTPGAHVALTSIDLEHREALGTRADLILSEKIELCPDGGVCAVPTFQDDLLRKLSAWGHIRKLQLLTTDEIRDKLAEAPITQIGDHQRENAALGFTVLADCLRSAKLLPKGDLPKRYLEACRTSMAEVALAGRLRQRSINGIPIWLDAAHTPRAMRAYAKAIHPYLPEGQAVMIVGASHDKSALELLAPIVEFAEVVFCVTQSERGTPADDIAKMIRSLRPAIPIHCCESPTDSLASGLSVAKELKRPVCIAGGLFLARDMEHAFERYSHM